jgi:ElaB/YqjD/DUF883 family membrane-anchored ribosome-binding protein
MNEAAKSRTEHARSPGAEEGAYARLEQDMTAVKTEVARLSEELGGAVASLGAIAQKNIRRGLKDARVRADEFASSASERAGAAGAALSIMAQDSASSAGDTLSEAIETRPLMAVGVALGLGFLIGAVLRR